MRRMDNVCSGKWEGTLSAAALKWIAISSMLLDHIGVAIIENGFIFAGREGLPMRIQVPGWMSWPAADIVLRTAGRLAFPLFTFLLVEGFHHTRNRRRYAGSLILFALISEVPFDLAVFDSFFEPSGQNVYFTLAIGLLMMSALERWGFTMTLKAGIILSASAVALFVHSDYTCEGILLIAMLYLYRDRKMLRNLFGGILMAVESLAVLGAAALALIPISLYSGERGGGRLASGRGKYLFYWFYPAHLLILYLLRGCLVGSL